MTDVVQNREHGLQSLQQIDIMSCIFLDKKIENIDKLDVSSWFVNKLDLLISGYYILDSNMDNI